VSAQPEYGFDEDNDEVQTRATVKFKDYWSIFGGVAYDLNNNVVTRQTVGLSYEDECTIFTIAYSDKRDTSDESASDWTIGARLTFRTLGDINVGDASDWVTATSTTTDRICSAAKEGAFLSP
jgi:LPS-assembly protein